MLRAELFWTCIQIFYFNVSFLQGKNKKNRRKWLSLTPESKLLWILCISVLCSSAFFIGPVMLEMVLGCIQYLTKSKWFIIWNKTWRYFRYFPQLSDTMAGMILPMALSNISPKCSYVGISCYTSASHEQQFQEAQIRWLCNAFCEKLVMSTLNRIVSDTR